MRGEKRTTHNINIKTNTNGVITGSPFSPMGPAPPTTPERPGCPMAPAGPEGPLSPVGPWMEKSILVELELFFVKK